mgnify:CR=1 FL=1
MALLAGGLVLSGCAPQTPPAETPQSTEATAAPPDAEGALPEATVSQWASVVASVDRETRDAFTDWDTGECLPSDDNPLCKVAMLGMESRAQVVSLELKAAGNPDAPAFIGAAPDEIAPLVASTRAAADAAAEAAGTAAGCPEAPCVADAASAISTYSRLIAELDSWAPYL